MRKVTDLGPNEVIHCPTEQEANAICALMHEAGLTWNTNRSYLKANNWHYEGKNTCYRPYTGSAGRFSHYKDNDYIIYSASDFLFSNSTGKSNTKHIEILQRLADNTRACIENAGNDWISEMLQEYQQAELEALNAAIQALASTPVEITQHLEKPTP